MALARKRWEVQLPHKAKLTSLQRVSNQLQKKPDKRIQKNLKETFPLLVDPLWTFLPGRLHPICFGLRNPSKICETKLSRDYILVRKKRLHPRNLQHDPLNGEYLIALATY